MGIYIRLKSFDTLLLVSKGDRQMKQAYMYLRVSTKVQTEKFGIDVQKEEIKNYCLENDIEIIGSYEDDGITGKIVEREGLQQMLSDMESNKIKYVICLNCSRLWRSDIAGGLIRFNLSKIDADIISVQEPSYSLYTNDPSDYLINSIMQALASYDRMQINKKLAAGRSAKARKGQKSCGSAPFGYSWQDAEIVIDYNNHLIVQDIFMMYAECRNLAEVSRRCTDKGYKTNTGNDFSKQAISNMIHNDFYTGIVTHAGTKTPGTHHAIISKELFEAVQ